MSNALSQGVEENILTLLIWNTQHALTLASVIDDQLFSHGDYQKIAKAAIRYINRFHVPPGDHIRDLLENDLRRKEGKFLRQIIEDSKRLSTTLNSDYVIAELDKFIRIQTKTNALNAAYEALSVGDEEKADEVLWQNAAPRVNTSIGVWLHDDNMDFLEQAQGDWFSSGVEALDQRGIRPERGTMTLLIGTKKGGKSWWAVNIGKAALQYGHTTLHLSLENSQSLTKRRYLQAFFAMTKSVAQTIDVINFKRDTQGNFVSFEKTQQIDRISLTLDNRAEIVRRIRTLRSRPRLLIKAWPTGMLTIPQLNAFLDLLERTENFVPDMLIVDMPELFKINPAHKREETGIIFQQLRGIAVARNMALCVPTQGNRESEGATWVTSREVAEDWSKVGVADTVLTLNRTPEEREKKLARILVDAARDEADKFVVLILQDYAIGQFCRDSVYMNPAATAALDRATSGKEEPVIVMDENYDAA